MMLVPRIVMVECMTLSRLPGAHPAPGGLGAVLEAHEHGDLRTERLLVELDRFLAAAVEKTGRFHGHGVLLVDVVRMIALAGAARVR
jgi:hypothetical protein